MLVFLLVLDLTLIEPLIIVRVKLFEVSVCLLSGPTVHVNIPLPLNSSKLFPGGWLDSNELGNASD